jgi:sugar O-acyltransferase (sialic acid O-acetyltransferase NeuD family)
MEKVVIFGATQLAVLMHFYLTHDSPYEVAAFTVDRDYIEEETMCGLPVVPFEEIVSVYPPGDYKMFVAIWYGRVNKTRAEKCHQARAKGYELISYISSRAITWPGLVVGDNCIIGNSVIQPFVKIGDNVSIRDGGVICHHAVIKDHCFVASGVVVLGGATVEPYCFLGANSTIRNDITVARECIIGAGTLILENTQEKGVYKGNPPQLLPMPSDELKSV